MRLTETYDNLIEKLKTKEEYFDENGELLKSKVIYEAQNDSESILEVLLSDEKLTNTYFKTIKDTKIFLKDKFINTINHKEFFPSSYTSYLNYIGLSDGTDFIKKSKDVVLNFPYKDCVLEGGQSREEQSLKEFFYNETLANDEVDRLLHPKVFTNIRKYTKDGVEENPSFKHTDNLLIKGNNLIALHSLVKRYEGRVKLIYIDPPYNTDSDSFQYNDSFNHSSWLTFMKNRLDIAKKMLDENGFIFIQIDDKEVFYLKILCDEIFGKDNFISSITVKMSHLSGMKMSHRSKKIPKIKEHILVFSKNKNLIEFNEEMIETEWDEVLSRYGAYLIRDKKEPNDCSKWIRKTVREVAIEKGIDVKDKKEYEKFKIENAENIFRTATNDSEEFKKIPNDTNFRKIITSTKLEKYSYKREEILFASKYVKNGKVYSFIGDIWDDIGINNLHNEGGVDFKNGKKPYKLLERIIRMTTIENDIVLDFFSGSGTTADVAMSLNRQFLTIEQLDYIENLPLERIQNGIGDSNKSFTYMELMKNNQSYIDTITECTSSSQLIEIKNELKNSNFIRYEVKDENLFDDKNQFDTLPMDEQKEILIKILDKNHLYVNYSEMDDTQFDISDEVKKFNREFYEVK